MKQEFVTLPREAVEQALKAMENAGMQRGSTAAEFNAIESLRAALEQPQAEQPAMTPIAQRKLDSLLAEGYTISGYSIYHEQKHQHGFVTGAGLVGWWRPEGVEYPQPQGEQEPMFWYRPRSDGLYEGPLHKSQIERVRKESGGWVPLYTHPQPKREPLTDEEINKINRSTTWPVKSLASLGDRQWAELLRCAASAIEAAHNIK